MVKVFPFNTPSPGEGIIFCLFSFCFSGSVGGGDSSKESYLQKPWVQIQSPRH